MSSVINFMVFDFFRLIYIFIEAKLYLSSGGVFMKKIICKVTYDTDTAEFIAKKTEGYIGDPAGFEECLFKNADGKYFMYYCGGQESKYPKEDIKRISAEKAEAWLSEIK